MSWLKKKSHKKSAFNIINSLWPLVAAVRADYEGATYDVGKIAALGPALEQGHQLSEMEVMGQMEASKRWRTRKAKVIKAQKKLYWNIALWSSLPPERAFSEVILPALFEG